MNDGGETGGRSELDTSMLLPPNYFTVPTPRASSHDPLWTRSALQEELERLRTEVVELRQRRPTSPSSDAAFAAGGGSSISILNEVILQQTNELNRLRSETEMVKNRYNQELLHLKEEVEAQKRQVVENEETFDRRLRHVEDDYEKQLQDKNTEINSLLEQQNNEQSSWKHRELKWEEEVDRKLREKDLRISDLCRLNDQLGDQVNGMQSQLQSAHQDIERLRICESWAVDRAEIINRNQELERHLQKSEATNSLKQQRLNTLQDVLTIQEKEISKFGPIEKQEAVAALLGRWREKVFSLMVQTESDRIAQANAVQGYRHDITELERILDHTRVVATTNELKLKACQAEVQDEKENFKQCKFQLDDVRGTLQKVTAQRDSLVTSMSTMRRTVESLVRSSSAQERELLSKTLTSINSMDRRMQGISDRLPVLKAQIKRLQAKEAVNQLREEYESRFNDLKQELDVVRADRDRLAIHMENDAEQSGSRERNLRQEYETEINFLAQKCDKLLSELETKSKRLETVEADVADLQKYSAVTQEENDDLKSRLSALEESHNEAVRIVTTELYEEHAQQMAQLNATLDEARREHTTAVMDLRQTERDLDRARSEHSTELLIFREQSDKQISNLQQMIHNLETERNLLKATLRQEGLLKTSTSPRLEKIRMPVSFPTRSSDNDQEDAVLEKTQKDFGPHLANLIEEVRSLVRSVEGSGDIDISDDDIE